MLNFHLIWNTSRYERLYVCLFVFVVLFCNSFGSRLERPCVLQLLVKMLIRLCLMWEGLALLYRNFVFKSWVNVKTPPGFYQLLFMFLSFIWKSPSFLYELLVCDLKLHHFSPCISTRSPVVWIPCCLTCWFWVSWAIAADGCGGGGHVICT